METRSRRKKENKKEEGEEEEEKKKVNAFKLNKIRLKGYKCSFEEDFSLLVNKETEVDEGANFESSSARKANSLPSFYRNIKKSRTFPLLFFQGLRESNFIIIINLLTIIPLIILSTSIAVSCLHNSEQQPWDSQAASTQAQRRPPASYLRDNWPEGGGGGGGGGINNNHAEPAASKFHHHRHYKRHQKWRLHSAPRREQDRRNRRSSSGLSSYYDDAAADRPVVATKKGLVRGITQKIFTGKFVDAFLGIPYAQPPVGRYRFRHPQAINAWQGELDASRLPNSCFQVNDTFFGSSFLGTSVWNANTPLNEDCLYLNIWSPFGTANTTLGTPSQQQHYSQQSSSKRPVLVWIFGGGFYSGTSSLALYEGGVLASEEDIIVVSMNYRVSALGFLYFGRPDAPGNAGLFDQLMALQWINDNIHQFGGDPTRVTIFGESAGAVSVALHLLSPLSRNLFSQAILQSGAATCPWGFMEAEEIVANGLQLSSMLNCPSNSTDLSAVVECLRKADPMALVSQEVGQTKTILNFPFVPVVDGSFLLESPAESLAKSNFKPARILLGSNYDEGNSFLIYMSEFSHCPSGSSADYADPPPQGADGQSAQSNNIAGDESGHNAAGKPHVAGSTLTLDRKPMESLDLLAAGRQHPAAAGANQQHLSEEERAKNQVESQNVASNDSKPCRPNETLSLSREDFIKVLRDELNPYAKYPLAKDAIVFEYTNWNNPHDSVSNYDALDKIVGDYYFTCHVNEFAQRYASAGNAVFMYYFRQHSSISPWPKWMGVLHGDEINFVFGEPLNPMFNYTPKEIDLSRRMMRYWANFAKYGNPINPSEPSSSPNATKWPEYSDKRQYFELHSDFTRIGRGPRSKQCAFWAHYLPQLLDSFNRQDQCPATHRRHPYIHPPPFGLANSPDSSGTANPSFVIVSLSVIVVLAIISLLVYAERSGKLDLGFSSTNGNSSSNNNNNNSGSNNLPNDSPAGENN